MEMDTRYTVPSADQHRAIVAIGYFLLWLLFSGSDDELVDSWTMKTSLGVENQHQEMTRGEFKDFELERDFLARQINSGIREYYKQKGFYPKGVVVLSIAETDKYAKYHMGIRYRSDLKTFYSLKWLASSPWNGMQCISGDVPETELTQELGVPYYDNCYVNDLH